MSGYFTIWLSVAAGQQLLINIINEFNIWHEFCFYSCAVSSNQLGQGLMFRIRNAFFALVAVLLSPMTANADFIYDWSGPCARGCTGTATAKIVLSDSYIPGTILRDAALFQLFTFSSSLGSFSITAATVNNNSPYIFRFDPTGGYNQIASTTSNGLPFWRINRRGFDGVIGGTYYTGRPAGFELQQVSEPGTLALLGIGLLGMGLIRRKLT